MTELSKLTDEEIEAKAKEALRVIEQSTLLCDGDDEEHIFFIGFHSAYRQLEKENSELRKKIELAFEAGRKFEHGEHFGRVPNPCQNKDQWIKDNL